MGAAHPLAAARRATHTGAAGRGHPCVLGVRRGFRGRSRGGPSRVPGSRSSRAPSLDRCAGPGWGSGLCTPASRPAQSGRCERWACPGGAAARGAEQLGGACTGAAWASPGRQRGAAPWAGRVRAPDPRGPRLFSQPLSCSHYSRPSLSQVGLRTMWFRLLGKVYEPRLLHP